MEQHRRHSKKRDAIFDVIRGTDTHPTAEWIYDKLKPGYPDLSLGTVYRNLTLFRKEGLIRPVTVVNGTERYDANVAPHPHFVCRACSSVYDVDISQKGSVFFELEQGGFQIESCDITYFGLCPRCTPQNQSQN